MFAGILERLGVSFFDSNRLVSYTHLFLQYSTTLMVHMLRELEHSGQSLQLTR